MLDKPISPLRQRMIDDMTARRFKEKVQKDYVRHVKNFAASINRDVALTRSSFRWHANATVVAQLRPLGSLKHLIISCRTAEILATCRGAASSSVISVRHRCR